MSGIFSFSRVVFAQFSTNQKPNNRLTPVFPRFVPVTRPVVKGGKHVMCMNGDLKTDLSGVGVV